MDQIVTAVVDIDHIVIAMVDKDHIVTSMVDIDHIVTALECGTKYRIRKFVPPCSILFNKSM